MFNLTDELFRCLIRKCAVGYIHEDTMSVGRGYWAKTTAATITYAGTPATIETLEVRQGWNMIGSLRYPIHVGLITSDLCLPPSLVQTE